MKIKPKKCAECKEEFYPNNSLVKYCSYKCSKINFKPIKQRSDKRKKEEATYLKKRREYLINHPICEVKHCNNRAIDIHHKKRRIGNLLIDNRYFMAVCRNCHIEIENNPNNSKEKGYLL